MADNATSANDNLFKLSNLLNTGLDKELFDICMEMLSQGVDPDVLSTLIRECRKEVARAESAETSTNSHIESIIETSPTPSTED